MHPPASKAGLLPIEVLLYLNEQQAAVHKLVGLEPTPSLLLQGYSYRLNYEVSLPNGIILLAWRDLNPHCTDSKSAASSVGLQANKVKG